MASSTRWTLRCKLAFALTASSSIQRLVTAQHDCNGLSSSSFIAHTITSVPLDGPSTMRAGPPSSTSTSPSSPSPSLSLLSARPLSSTFITPTRPTLTPSINLARNLESLELAYWNQGLDNYTDADFASAGLDGYRDYIRQFRDHEIVHFTVLNDAAGGGFTNCTYDTFDVYDIPTFLAQGQVVTSVGEGAFIGALGSE